MHQNNKGFTLIELLIVISIIVFLIVISATDIEKLFWNNIDRQISKDYIVTLMSEVEGYSYNSVTVGQEFLNTDSSLNTDISRFSPNENLAYYHGLYFTTDPNDPIDDTIDTGRNRYIYLTQYKQESYGSLIPRELSSLTVDPSTSPQILELDGLQWAERYKLPTRKTYYLFKVTGITEECRTGTNQLDWFTVLYSTAGITFSFHSNLGQIKDFDYKLCYSEIEDSLAEWENYLELRINRDNIKEFYFENLRNY